VILEFGLPAASNLMHSCSQQIGCKVGSRSDNLDFIAYFDFFSS
jgi:hypothetical protein